MVSRRSVMSRVHLATDADDVWHPRRLVAFHVGVVRGAVALGHQHADVAAYDLLGAKTEQALGGTVEGLDAALAVDDQHRVDGCVEQRLHFGCCPEYHGNSLPELHQPEC
jgi:hypothetical protein